MLTSLILFTLVACNPSPAPTVTVHSRNQPNTQSTESTKKTVFPSIFESKNKDWDEVNLDRIKSLYSVSYHPKWSGSVFLHLSPGYYLLSDNNPQSNDKKKRAFHLSTYERESRIPLLVYTPGDTDPGPRAVPASLQSTGSTLYSVLGVKPPETVLAEPLDVPLSKKPKVLIFMVYDALSWAHWDGYLAKQPVHSVLRKKSREWTNTWLGHVSSSTTVSHAVMSTGMPPRHTGIPINHTRTGMGTYEELFIDERPERLLVPTVADLYDVQNDNKPIIASFCSQARAAIAMAGHGLSHPGGDADIVAWQENYHGEMATNKTYWNMPPYLTEISPKKLLAELENPTFRGSPIKHNRHLFRSPYTIEFGERFIEAVLDNEPFGEDELTDVIFVNQKILDNIAHRMTADTEHFKEAMDALDLFMGRLLRSLDRRFGDDYMLLLTSDHGFGPGLAPPQKELDSRRLDLAKVVDQANSTLGVEGLVEDIQYLNVYLNPDILKQSGKNLDDVCAAFSPYKWVEHCITLNELDVPDELRMQSGL